MTAIAAALGSSEDAAKMRLSRSLDKLRDYFAKRGIPISSAGLATVISGYSVQAAPAGLAAVVTSGICGGAVVTASTLTLAKGTLTMMTWTKINIGIAAVAIAAVGYQWHEASVANQRATQLEQQLNQQTGLYNQQQAAIKQLQESNDALVKQIDSAPQSVAAVATASSAGGAASPAPPTGVGSSKGFLAQMLKDPAMNQMMRAQQEQVLKTQYGPLARQLKLTPEQTDQFFSILSNQQNANMTNGLNMLSGGDQAADAAKANKTLEADTESQLQTLLGNDGYTQYSQYKDGLLDKMLLDQMTPSFADNPLTSDQQQQLLQVMRTERQNAVSIPGQAQAPTDPTDMAGNIDRAMQQQEQANQQVLQQAAAFLSADQLQTLGTAQSNFLNMQKAGAAMAQSMFGGGAKQGNQPSQ